LLEQDAESAWLELEPADDTDAMPHLRKKEQDIRPPVTRITIPGAARELASVRLEGRAVAESASSPFNQQGSH
jgi:hypothetical protein